MTGEWLRELETLEAIAQDEAMRELLLRMADLSADRGLGTFLEQLSRERGVDPETAGAIAELASDAAFLYAVEDYVRRTALAH